MPHDRLSARSLACGVFGVVRLESDRVSGIAAVRRALVRLLSPGLASCFRCGRGWGSEFLRAEEHLTKYSPGRGCFPLCETCWSSLTVDERLPYYRRLWDSWNHAGFWIQYADGTWHEWPAPVAWTVIEKAVRTEVIA